MQFEEWELNGGCVIDDSNSFAGEDSLKLIAQVGGTHARLKESYDGDKITQAMLQTYVNVGNNSPVAFRVFENDYGSSAFHEYNEILLARNSATGDLDLRFVYLTSGFGFGYNSQTLATAGGWDNITLSDGNPASTSWFNMRIYIWENGSLYAEVYEDADEDGTFTQIGDTITITNPDNKATDTQPDGVALVNPDYEGIESVATNYDNTSIYY